MCSQTLDCFIRSLITLLTNTLNCCPQNLLHHSYHPYPTIWCVWSVRPSSPWRLPHLKCLLCYVMASNPSQECNTPKLMEVGQWISDPSAILPGTVTTPAEVMKGVPSNVALPPLTTSPGTTFLQSSSFRTFGYDAGGQLPSKCTRSPGLAPSAQ